MIKNQLRAIIDRVFVRERISANDVRELQREVFEDGLTCREDIEVLGALDRAIPAADPSWATFFIASVVEFVVWTSRPTGYVDEETARWLVTALMPMDRATANAHLAALEIVREAHQVDEVLLPLLLTPRETVHQRRAA
jgi:nucleotide-binding universal stress UspA family protein